MRPKKINNNTSKILSIMARIISINSVKNSVKNATLAATVSAMCVSLNLSAQDAAAAKAALADIAAEEGTAQARAIIVSMQPDFPGFYA